MKTRLLGLVLATGLWTVAAGAEQNPAPLVLRVFGDFHTAADLGLSAEAVECRELTPFVMAVVEPLLAAYRQQAGIAVTEDDLMEYCRRQLPEDASFKEAWAEWQPGGSRWGFRERSAVELAAWKLQKALFAEYGGGVLRNPGGQPQAIGALVALAAAREEAGDFTIYNERLRMRFWECLRLGWGKLVPEEQGRKLIEQHPADRVQRPAPAAP